MFTFLGFQITEAEAQVIMKVLDNDQSRKTTPPAIEKLSFQSRSVKTTANDNSFDQLQSTKQKVSVVAWVLDLHRSTKSEIYANQTEADACQKPDGLANAAATQSVVDPAEEADFKNVLDQCGYSELMHLMERSNNEWRDTKIEIAITGESGSGKSSLINALRGLKDDAPEAAIPGCIEATMERKKYQHPDNANLVLWDLPGVGTPNFPQETYIKKACFNDYDFIIMVSQSRYTITDTWLAEKIQNIFPDSNLFFVRTKIDVDLGSIQKGRSKHMSDEELQGVFRNIKQNCYDNLKKARINNPYVFMVDNHDTSAFEFGKLANTLVAKVSALKKDALIMTIQGFTKEIVAAKYDLCIARMKAITKQAAIAAMNSNRKHENRERFEVEILKQEVMLYKHQLGIDTNSLDIVARRFGIDREEVYVKLNSETQVILRNFEQFYLKHDKVVPSNRHSLPFMSQFFLLRSYQKQCLYVLKIVLDKCIDENNTLQKNIAVWELLPN
ncbi:hypothetical protein DPMN_055075 [Dreissena polymorpha]|uniref:IRG-type G domain-containing protein n=1 Tax=Dreissena polymorpha TaxID=45954 RepID=A0A9D4CR42_DREPO|nr:hypothetical protein DPMN_055075 [Dreissena polymorpha]